MLCKKNIIFHRSWPLQHYMYMFITETTTLVVKQKNISDKNKKKPISDKQIELWVVIFEKMKVLVPPPRYLPLHRG